MSDWLVEVNTLTGEADLIGETGFNDIWGLSFINNILYGITASGELISLNTASGEGSLLNNSPIQYAGMTTFNNNCSGSVAPDLDLHFPSLDFTTSQGSINVWAYLDYQGTNSVGQHTWELVNFGVNQTESCTIASDTGNVSENLDITPLPFNKLFIITRFSQFVG